jgi:hypothetical protein
MGINVTSEVFYKGDANFGGYRAKGHVRRTLSIVGFRFLHVLGYFCHYGVEIGLGDERFELRPYG